LTSQVHYQRESDSGNIRLWIAGIYPEFQKWAKCHNFDGDLLPEITFKKQLKKEAYFVKTVKARFRKKVRSVFILNIDKMKEKGLAINDEWM